MLILLHFVYLLVSICQYNGNHLVWLVLVALLKMKVRKKKMGGDRREKGVLEVRLF